MEGITKDVNFLPGFEVVEFDNGSIKFTYESDGIDKVGDELIKKKAAEMDLHFSGEGYNLVTCVRDICFDKISNDLHDRTDNE